MVCRQRLSNALPVYRKILMQEFVAIDFETANEQRRSACAIGLVAFDGQGTITDRFYTLLRPHADVDYFNPVNVWIHGITAEDVADAPEWSDVREYIADFIGDRPLVAHNMAFDGYVLSDLDATYGHPALTNPRLCTLRMARQILATELERKNLDAVLNHYFPGESFNHHEASADAETCGRIFARMQEEYGFDHLVELCPPNGSPRRRRPAQTVANQGVVDELLTHYGDSTALMGERVTITGTLQRGQRADVQKLIESLGGAVEKNLTKKTTILVVGIPNPAAWSEGSSGSRKLAKATKLREAGSPIEVLTEEEFFHRLGDEQ